jgi:hypothetical protein
MLWVCVKSIRAARPDGAPIYVIMDNLSANKTPSIRRWAARHKVELCFTPTNASWANTMPGSVRTAADFTMANPDYPNHTVLTPNLQAYLPWRNIHARHLDVWPPNPANAPASAANASNGGDDPDPEPPDPPRLTFVVSAPRPNARSRR